MVWGEASQIMQQCRRASRNCTTSWTRQADGLQQQKATVVSLLSAKGTEVTVSIGSGVWLANWDPRGLGPSSIFPATQCINTGILWDAPMNIESWSWKEPSMLKWQQSGELTKTVQWNTGNVVTLDCWSEIGFVQIQLYFFTVSQSLKGLKLLFFF